jgi:hypothetical protein
MEKSLQKLQEFSILYTLVEIGGFEPRWGRREKADEEKNPGWWFWWR